MFRYVFLSLFIIFLLSSNKSYSFIAPVSAAVDQKVSPGCIKVTPGYTHKYTFMYYLGMDSTGAKQRAIELRNNCANKIVVTRIETSTIDFEHLKPVDVIRAVVFEGFPKAKKISSMEDYRKQADAAMKAQEDFLKQSDAEIKAQIDKLEKAIHPYLFTNKQCDMNISLVENEYIKIRNEFAELREKWQKAKTASEELPLEVSYIDFENLPAVLPRRERDEKTACGYLEIPVEGGLKLGIEEKTYYRITGTVKMQDGSSQPVTVEGKLIDRDDPVEAARLAAKGDNFGRVSLAQHYLQTGESLDKVENLLSAAAQEGYRQAWGSLAYAYETGKGASQDFEKAYFWYSIAANNPPVGAIFVRPRYEKVEAMAKQLTPQQITALKKEIDAWEKTHPPTENAPQ